MNRIFINEAINKEGKEVLPKGRVNIILITF